MKLTIIMCILLFSVFTMFLFGRFLGKKGVFYFSTVNTFIVFFVSALTFISHLVAEYSYVECVNFGS